MRRTATRLADGRELIYFDDSDTAEGKPVRELVDPRDLPPRTVASELRWDPLRAEWVAIASHRQGRTHLPPSDQCPLCPSSSGRATGQTEIPSSDYDVVVFENRFPSFAHGGGDLPGMPGDTPVDVADLMAEPDGVDARRPGHGRCEVLCFTADHNASFAALRPHRARTVVDAWADRTVELGRLPGINEVFCFENRGEEIGVTLHHPHGQIYAFPFVTPRTRRTLDIARAHRDRTGRNLFADVVDFEMTAQERVIHHSTYWTAFVPAAARWPVEVHLYPNRQVPDIPALSSEERDDFAHVYLDVLGRLERFFDLPLPYIAAWHQAPARVDRDLAYLHLEVFSIRRAANKLKYLAGTESGMGVFVNDLLPEEVARRLRESA